MPQARLRALHQLFAGLVTRPEPAALVVGCTDHEVIHLVRALLRLDAESPTDRFLLLTHPFIDPSTYIANLTLQRPVPGASSPADPSQRLAALLAELPPGDHRLVLALLPTEIHDRDRFSSLALELLAAPLDPRLRLIIRDDRLDPRHLDIIAADPSDSRFAHVFSLPPELLLAAVHTVAHDRSRPPDERAVALLQLASLDLGQGRHTDALARCEALSGCGAAPALVALALALEADVLRHRGEHDAAAAAGLAALQHAVAADAAPVVVHAALALAELCRERGRVCEAATCYELAERALTLDGDALAHVHDLRTALREVPC